MMDSGLATPSYWIMSSGTSQRHQLIYKNFILVCDTKSTILKNFYFNIHNVYTIDLT